MGNLTTNWTRIGLPIAHYINKLYQMNDVKMKLIERL